MSRGLVANNESAAMPRDMSIWKHGAVKNLFVLRVAALSTHVLGRPFATAQGDTDSTMLIHQRTLPSYFPDTKVVTLVALKGLLLVASKRGCSVVLAKSE